MDGASRGYVRPPEAGVPEATALDIGHGAVCWAVLGGRGWQIEGAWQS